MSVKKVKATFDFAATEEGELTIKKGDIITVLEEDESGRCRGCACVMCSLCVAVLSGLPCALCVQMPAPGTVWVVACARYDANSSCTARHSVPLCALLARSCLRVFSHNVLSVSFP